MRKITYLQSNKHYIIFITCWYLLHSYVPFTIKYCNCWWIVWIITSNYSAFVIPSAYLDARKYKHYKLFSIMRSKIRSFKSLIVIFSAWKRLNFSQCLSLKCKQKQIEKYSSVFFFILESTVKTKKDKSKSKMTINKNILLCLKTHNHPHLIWWFLTYHIYFTSIKKSIRNVILYDGLLGDIRKKRKKLTI